jgi:hypothetical protein
MARKRSTKKSNFLERFSQWATALAGMAAKEGSHTVSHSIDEAKARHDAKTRRRRRAG